MGHELSHGQASDWHIHGQANNIHTDTGNDNTWRPKLASVKNKKNDISETKSLYIPSFIFNLIVALSLTTISSWTAVSLQVSWDSGQTWETFVSVKVPGYLTELQSVVLQMCMPDSKVHGANMGPIWGRQDPGGPHVGPMNLAIWHMGLIPLISIILSSGKNYIESLQYT